MRDLSVTGAIIRERIVCPESINQISVAFFDYLMYVILLQREPCRDVKAENRVPYMSS